MSIIGVVFHSILGGGSDGSAIDPRVLRIGSRCFVKSFTLATLVSQ